MGSKNKIAKWVLSHIPSRENFYDLFCGGCAITHCALEQRMFKNYYINDIKADMPQLFIDCINGKMKGENRWISKDDFDKLKGKGDSYVDICFSFGNNWKKGYAYSKEIEPFKKAFHYAIFFDDYSLMKDMYNIDLSPLKMFGSKIYDKYIQAKKYIEVGLNSNLQHLESFTRLQSLERLNQLNSLSKLGYTLNSSSLSYDNVFIKPNSIIYCDIPYKDTASYNESSFDHEKFYEWALSQKELVFISEYNMPSDNFVCIAETSKTCQLSATNNRLESTERIFVPKHQYKKPINLFDL